MTYDGLDRLTKVVSPMYATATDNEARYGYDVLDNLVTVHVRDRHHFYCHDASNRLTNIKTGYCDSGQTVIGLGYDPQGNLENRNGQLFEFDYGNRLRGAVGKETYRYDGHGRRVLARSEQGQGAIRSLYGNDGVLRYQWNDRQQKVFNHIYLAGSLIATRETPYNSSVNTIKYQHTDALGSPVAVTESNRTVIERFEHEPFGKVINPANPKDGPGYTGHVYDAATGLNYMQQRYYDPSIGRFLSVDPVAVRPIGDNFNRYWYANNNPYKFTDPDGRDVVCSETKCTVNSQSKIGEIVDWGTVGLIYVTRLIQNAVDNIQQQSQEPTPETQSESSGNGEDKPRFIAQPDGQVVDTEAPPAGSYDQPNGGRTDILQGEDHGSGRTHTHDPVVNTNPKTGESFVNGRERTGRQVSEQDVKNIQSGDAPRSQPTGRSR